MVYIVLVRMYPTISELMSYVLFRVSKVYLSYKHGIWRWPTGQFYLLFSKIADFKGCFSTFFISNIFKYKISKYRPIQTEMHCGIVVFYLSWDMMPQSREKWHYLLSFKMLVNAIFCELILWIDPETIKMVSLIL